MNKVDAAVLWIDSKTAYFFCDDQYVRYDIINDLGFDGYPAAITANWRGLSGSFGTKIDAVLLNPAKTKAFFLAEANMLDMIFPLT